MYIIPALGRLRQEDQELETSLNYIANPVSKQEKKKKTEKISLNFIK
jgi:hypothetical protein